MSTAQPRVDFYLDADSKLAVAARLAQKGIAAGMRLLVLVADDDAMAQADRMLWTFSPLSFVPHAREGSTLAAESPVLLSQKITGNATSGFGVLMNLKDSMPDTIVGFQRVIEIVSHDDTDKATARERFKAYREMGCALLTHRLGQNE